MPRLFFGNFDFEHELANPRGWNAPDRVLRMNAERCSAWIAIAEEGDLIWTPQPITDSFWVNLANQGLPRVRGVCDLSSLPMGSIELVPWGWSSSAAKFASQAACPDLNLVRIGNSRQWSFNWERELGVALPGASRLEQLDDFPDVIGRAASELGVSVDDQAWVLKANFGMAARERLLGRGLILSEAQQRWIQKRIAADGAVYFEPWLPLREEVGIQWDVPPTGRGDPKLIGLSALLTDASGSYLGSQLLTDDVIPERWQRAVELTQRTANRLQSLGYFGPLGIDAAWAEDSRGAAIARPIQDINARYTMGRLALGFRRLLKPGESGEWLHSTRDKPLPNLTDVATEIVTSPDEVGNRSCEFVSRFIVRGV